MVVISKAYGTVTMAMALIARRGSLDSAGQKGGQNRIHAWENPNGKCILRLVAGACHFLGSFRTESL